jgi:hypothetical protein
MGEGEAVMDVEKLRALLEKATPGPWSPGHIADDSHECECRYIFGNDGRAGAVGEVYLAGKQLHSSEYPPLAEARANAALIALTPDFARSVIALTEDLAARDKAHECDAQIAADLIAGEQAKRYEVEAERDKLRAALQTIAEISSEIPPKGASKEGWLDHQMLRVCLCVTANLDRIAALAQATQETGNATQEEKQNG